MGNAFAENSAIIRRASGVYNQCPRPYRSRSWTKTAKRYSFIAKDKSYSYFLSKFSDTFRI